MKCAVDISWEYVARVLHAAPFADNNAGIPQMCALISALRVALDRELNDSLRAMVPLHTEIDALHARIAALESELAQLRRAVDETAVSLIAKANEKEAEYGRIGAHYRKCAKAVRAIAYTGSEPTEPHKVEEEAKP